ncbi:MAG: hypothetical protein IKO49_02930 [Bacilli bacterium]|nr:hypothetical protein [Bacilli bacterium]
MSNKLIRSYFNSKIQYNYLYNYYNSNDSYINSTIRDCLSKYDKNLKAMDKYKESRTLNYVYLLYNRMCINIYYCINSQLKTILLKFNKMADESNNLEMIKLLPQSIKYYLTLELSNSSEIKDLDTVNQEIERLNNNISPFGDKCDCDLYKLMLICDQLNDVLEMLYEPKKWYEVKKNYLNAEDATLTKEVFNKFFPNIGEE